MTRWSTAQLGLRRGPDEVVCANELHWLIRDTAHTSWPTGNFATDLDMMIEYWNAWI
jgi:hypothetical protein